MSLSDVVPAAGKVTITRSAADAGAKAAAVAAQVMRKALQERGTVRVVFASAPSQDATVRTVGTSDGIDWSRVRSLHLDEYRGIDPKHRAGFGRWLADRLPPQAQPGLERIRTDGDAQGEISRYSSLLSDGPIDLVCLGIGVNGHLAFNEPGETDFNDTAILREVALSHASRKQQVDEGLFEDLGQVPTHALSMTVPAILRGSVIVGTVLGEAKADAVAAALTGPITPELPASALRTHEQALLFLDSRAASALPADYPSLSGAVR